MKTKHVKNTNGQMVKRVQIGKFTRGAKGANSQGRASGANCQGRANGAKN